MRIRSLLIAVALLGGCTGEPKFEAQQTLGGRVVRSEALRDGYASYMQYCRPCHGERGDGRGYSSYGLRPPPRDFTQALFKFGGVPAGATAPDGKPATLPPDSELKRIVKGGLHGTAMLPWDITDEELDAVLQYVKTFPKTFCLEQAAKNVEADCKDEGEAKAAECEKPAGKNLTHSQHLACKEEGEEVTEKCLQKPQNNVEKVVAQAGCDKLHWETEGVGTPVKALDPKYTGEKKTQAIALGKQIFHGKAQCSASCHPNFITHEELYGLTKQTTFSPEMYQSQPKDSEYCIEWQDKRPRWRKFDDRACKVVAKVLPPDFTRDNIRAGTTVEDLYRTIGSGVAGAGMPPWKGTLTDDELWGLAYYVRSLIELRDTAEGKALHTKLADPANMNWLPKEAAASPTDAPKTGDAAKPEEPKAAPKAPAKG